MQVLAAMAWSVAWIGAALLVLAGLAKVRRPAATADTLALAGLPDRPGPARVLGVGEVILGAAVLLTGEPVPVAILALAYATFAGVSGYLLRTGQGSCGCFGEVDAPLSRVHVVTDVVVAVAAAGAAVTAPPVPGTGVEWVLLGLLVVTGAAVVRMLLVLVPAVADGVRRVRAT